jgi:hypothetical protein
MQKKKYPEYAKKKQNMYSYAKMTIFEKYAEYEKSMQNMQNQRIK